MKLARLLSVAFACGFAAALAAAPLGASPPPAIKAKQQQAQVVLAQVDALDRQLGTTVEAWNGANYDLGKVRVSLAANRKSLRIAELARRRAEQLVQARLVTIYESDEPTTIDVVLGSASLGDLIDRLQAEQSVASSDRKLARHAQSVRDELAGARSRLRKTESRRVASVQQLSQQRLQIGAMLSQRRRLLASVQSELATLRAAEARRQAALAAEARRRLAAEQAELRREAAERRRAAEEAARAANARTTPAATTTAQTTTAAAPTTTTPVATTAPVTTVVAPTTATDPLTTTDPIATTTTEVPSAPLPAGHPAAATIALRYLGVKYVWGGESPKGFDCSGLVAYVFAQLGITLPHYAAAQYGLGAAVPRDQLQPGDLVFFDGLDHVGIYIGGDQFVHAPHTGDVVKITSMAAYGGGYVGARRI
ncbi:MAG TPA: NlpC/P60 family protein [Gaiellaceae bacterium]|nr:NlpC/P60 family protein [Gaiellaceae bacterium]